MLSHTDGSGCRKDDSVLGCAHLDACVAGKAQVACALAGVRKDDAFAWHAQGQHSLQLCLGGAVKAGTQGRQQLQQRWLQQCKTNNTTKSTGMDSAI